MEKTLNQPETETVKKLGFQEQFEKEQTEIQDALEAFDIDDFIQDTDQTQTAYVPGIGKDKKGRIIKFKRLNAGDGEKLAPYQNQSQYRQGLHALALMMSKADGKTTYEKLVRMDATDVAAILQATQKTQKFFRPKKSRRVVPTES